MAAKKACCCMKVRTCTLVFLYFYLVDYVWSLLSALSTYGDPISKQYIQENAAMYYVNLLFIALASFIFLATIISIHNDAPSLSLINTAIAFVLLKTVFTIYVMTNLNAENIMNNWYSKIVEQQVGELPLDMQDKHRKDMESLRADWVQSYLILPNVGLAIVSMISLYSAYVFYCYNVELKTNPVNYGVHTQMHYLDNEANISSAPPAYNKVTNTASGYPVLPPQYPKEASMYSVEYK